MFLLSLCVAPWWLLEERQVLQSVAHWKRQEEEVRQEAADGDQPAGAPGSTGPSWVQMKLMTG